MRSAAASDLLLFACNQGDVEQCQALVIDGKANLEHRNSLGETCLHIAAQRGHISVTELLLAFGADPNVCTAAACGRRTPLHIACKAGNIRLTEVLLSKFADANISDAQGRTPLHLAVASGEPTLVDLLLHHGATSDCPDIMGKTPRDYAVDRCFREAVALLTRPTADGDAPPPVLTFQQQLDADSKRIVYKWTKSGAV